MLGSFSRSCSRPRAPAILDPQFWVSFSSPLLSRRPRPTRKQVTWTGLAGSGGTANWNTTDANWSGSSTTYSDGLPVTFDDTGINTTITIPAVVSPGSIAFNNNNNTYIFSGAAISGTGGVALTGGGLVVLTNANTYSGHHRQQRHAAAHQPERPAKQHADVGERWERGL